MREMREATPEELIAHYQFIVTQWTEYYKLYLQSWTIFGGAVLVGFAAALYKMGEGVELESMPVSLLAIAPLIILIWFLFTSHFWAMFRMYSSYASDLEGRIRTLLHDPVAYRIYSNPGAYWFQCKLAAYCFVSVLIGLFCILGYGLIAYTVSGLAGKWGQGLFAAYVGAMILSTAAIAAFIYASPKATNAGKEEAERKHLTRKDLATPAP